MKKHRFKYSTHCEVCTNKVADGKVYKSKTTQKQVKQELVTKIIKKGGRLLKKFAHSDGWKAYALLLEYINKQRT